MSVIDCKPADALNAFDWWVVEIARIDGPSSIEPASRLARFVKAMFGISRARTLANARAESLRRFCVRAWHSGPVRDSDLRALTDAGYSMAQADQILVHIAGFRGFASSVHVAHI